ncbi:MAG TPA: hypothetical protein VN222_12850, partial [Novosphingobium sp.]|nr:hypothetical protein [Novosphingobium sp.]
MSDTPLHDLPQKAALLMQQADQKGSRMADSEDLRQRLRQTTDPAHRRLDAQMGALDLHTREGFGQFLMAHAAGLAVAFPAMQGFVQGRLGASLPDLPAMVAQDLAQIAPRASLPATPAPLPAHAGAGAAYVIIGSRLGTRVLAQRGFL